MSVSAKMNAQELSLSYTKHFPETVSEDFRRAWISTVSEVLDHFKGDFSIELDGNEAIIRLDNFESRADIVFFSKTGMVDSEVHRKLAAAAPALLSVDCH